MSITLYADSNFRGESLVIANDRATLRGTAVGNNPTSIRMTGDGDAVLLCKKRNWNGEVCYLRGKHAIADLGDPDDGGARGLGNAITSVRVKPFAVAVNVTIVTGEDGALPGAWASRADATRDIDAIIAMANAFYADEDALLKVELGDLTFRADEKRFRMAEKEWGSIPAAWKRARSIDVVFPDTIEGAVGLGNFPWHGKFCLVSARRNTVAEMARTFVHELGHYWGLTHESGGGQAANIMTQSDTGDPLTASRFRDGQIQEIQQKLARNLTRQGDRIE